MNIKYKPGTILFYCVFIIAVASITSCKKVGPANVAIVTPPPPPPPPCNGYWICLSAGNFSSVTYTYPPNQAFIGANGAAISTKNKIFFAGGHEEGSIGGTYGTIQVYNSDLNNWNVLSLSMPRSHLAGAKAGNKVLFAGGYDKIGYAPVLAIYYNNVDIYDTATYLMTTGKLSEARANMASASIGNKAFFIGGKTLTGYSKIIDIYDALSNSWSLVQMPNSRAYAGADVIGDKIYICGGENEKGKLKIIDVYDVTSGMWSVLQAPNEHPHASVVTLNNKIFIAGGDGIANRSLDVFNTINNTWSTLQLSDARYDMATSIANNKIIFLGGNYSDKIDVYNDNSGALSSSSLSEGVTGVIAGTLNDKCFFAGFLHDKGNAITNTVIIIQP